MTILSFEEVSFSYMGQTSPALSGVSFTCVSGGVTAVLGANGSGKSTLCAVARGLAPGFFPGELGGKVLLDGQSLDDLSPASLASKVGFAFQNPFTQLTRATETVREEISFGMENLGYDRDTVSGRVSEVLARFNLESIADRHPTQLSGGQVQRVALAAMFAMDPEVLIMDEPTSQMDPVATQMIFEMVAGARDAGKAVILAEQKLPEILSLADQVLVLSHGHCAASGSPADVLLAQNLEEFGLPTLMTTSVHRALKNEFHIPDGFNGSRSWLSQVIKGILQ